MTLEILAVEEPTIVEKQLLEFETEEASQQSFEPELTIAQINGDSVPTVQK